MNNLIKKDLFWITLLLILISVFAFFSYFPHHWNLSYGDAQSRLNISRKIVDNLTPGLAQLGNIWLPLPQLLMLPFIWIKSFWQSGFAGTLMSSLAFVIGGLYLYKTFKVYGLSVFWSFVSLSVYITNINAIYFQTTAMSESLFIAATCIAAYYFSLWLKTHDRFLLLKAAIAVEAMTLTRYEGLAVLFASYVVVFVMAFLINRRRSRAEGDTIIYATLASLGFGLWTVYLAAIFGDPLYWKNYYGATVEVNGQVQYAVNIGWLPSIVKYFTATVWMNGLMPVLLSLAGIVYMAYQILKNKVYYYVPVFLMSVIFLFMLLTLQKNTPINQPDLTLQNLMNPSISMSREFNIRYGLLMLPVVCLFVGGLFSIKSTVLKGLIFGLLLVQYASYFLPFTFLYKIPAPIVSQSYGGDQVVSWMKKNYDNGLIMVSALKHDPQMLQMGFDYQTYIHEGTGKYWKESVEHPSKYAKWIVMDWENKEDQVTKFVKGNAELEERFELMTDINGTRIYKLK